LFRVKQERARLGSRGNDGKRGWVENGEAGGEVRTEEAGSADRVDAQSQTWTDSITYGVKSLRRKNHHVSKP
jgi:hypothetical protein